MAARKHKIRHLAVYAVFTVAIIFGALCIWLYSGKLTSAKISAFHYLPLPIALVNGSPILMHDFLARESLGENMLTGDSARTKTAIFDELLREEQVSQLAIAKGADVNPQEINSEYQSRAGQAGLQGKDSFEGLLASYGLNPAAYKKEVVAPELRQINLQVWFNGQKNLNLSTYASAESLVQRIQNKEDMSALAKNFSSDENTKDIGGDMGFIDPAQTLPELRDPISSMRPGEVKILPSRYGLHVIRLEEKNGNNYHLRQIFLKTGDYSNWLASQTKNYKIKKLITF